AAAPTTEQGGGVGLGGGSAGHITGVGTLTVSQIPTRDELEDMEPSEIKEVAAAMGLVLPPRTGATPYIDHILGEAKAAAPTAEISDIPEVDVVSTNGYADAINADEVATRVAALLWERFLKAVAATA